MNNPLSPREQQEYIALLRNTPKPVDIEPMPPSERGDGTPEEGRVPILGEYPTQADLP